MANWQYVAICTLVVVMCVEHGYSIECFDCNSHNDTRCANEKPPDELKRPCPGHTPEGKPYVLCRKIKQVIDFAVNGLPPDTRIIRSCGWDDSSYSDRCYQRSGFGGRQEVCACGSNWCNDSTSIVASSSLLLALFTLLKLSH